MAKILVVEDDKDVANMVRTYLLFEHHMVETIADGREAQDHLRTFQYDLLILDWALPGVSGLEICKEYRGTGNTTPILMLTGKDKTADKEVGLDTGADDYLTKPFDMRELGARIRALLRRPGTAATSNILMVGSLSLDTSRHRVEKNGQMITLMAREFQLLEFLMRHTNQVFTPEALLNRVWPSESDSTPEALRTTIKRLRKKIDPEGEIIRNVHGVGYIMEVPGA